MSELKDGVGSDRLTRTCGNSTAASDRNSGLAIGSSAAREPATIVGMQWRSEERASIAVPLLQGWIYSVIFTPEGGSNWFHETSVKAIANPGEN